MPKYYITTAIDYVNAAPHLGHAYEKVAADVLARWHRLKGEDVFFLTGTDENAQKNAQAAKLAGIETKKFVDQNADLFFNLCKVLNLSNDHFIRTTDSKHIKVSQLIFKKLYDAGDIYKGNYEGQYCPGCEAFKTERDLVDGKCPEHNIIPEMISEENYFFKLSKYENEILKLVSSNTFILPEEKRNEIISRIKSDGLKDLCVTRKGLSWGISVPFDKDYKIYVWCDALVNYISALGYPDGLKFKKYWPADCHMIGKGINWFHTVIWPAILMSAKIKMPKQVYVHGYITIDGQKISKSLGNVIDPIELTKKYGVDPIRYFLMRNVPFGEDGDFSEKALITRTNTELADSLGNLLNRVVSMCEKYYDSKIPKAKEDKELSSKLDFKKIDSLILNYKLHEALAEIFYFVDQCNKYVNEKEPWNLAKNQKEDELEKVLFNLAESLRIISQLIYSFMPETAEKINEQLGFKLRDSFDLKWGNAKSKGIKKGETLFKKI
ncbi:MAG: methionine--tRNA ligase [Candidatus Nanoarchaeia archaeon]